LTKKQLIVNQILEPIGLDLADKYGLPTFEAEEQVPEFDPSQEYVGSRANEDWTTTVEDLFEGERLVGFERITPFKFEDVLGKRIKRYTVFVDNKSTFLHIKYANKRMIFTKFLDTEKIQTPIYYYAVWDKSMTSVESFLNVIKRNREIHGKFGFEKLDNYKIGGVHLFDEITLKILPKMYVDMLSLIYNVSEITRDINAIVLLSNNSYLVPAIQQLVDNDIEVYLGVSQYVRTSPYLMRACTGVILMDDYLNYTNVMQEKDY